MSEAPLEPPRGAATEASPSPVHPGRRSHRGWWIGLALLVAVAGGWWGLHRAAPAPTATQPRPVSVAAAALSRRDVPIILEGLGSVAAFKTVTVRPQVDGRLDQVFFKEGQAVRAGQALAQIDPRPFQIQGQQAEGALARDNAMLTSARLDLERYRTLVKDKLISQQQVDVQSATVGQLEGTVRVDQAILDTARLNMEFARVTSPVDGVTGIRLVDQGNLVHASDPGGLVIVTQLDPISVIFTLPQDQLGPVAGAMALGPLSAEAFARDGATLLGTGRLELIDNQINQATSTIRLKAVFPNPKHTLWPNQFVNVRLRLALSQGALVMPATAVQRGPNGQYVYVIGADATVATRPVEVVAAPGDLVVVTKGLQEGERVVVDGQGQLRPGSKVITREAAAPAGAERASARTPAGEAAAR